MPAGNTAVKAIFVVGCPRSGTTLVGNLIGACPEVFNGEESFFLWLMSRWQRMLRPPVAPLAEAFLAQAQVLMRDLITSQTQARRRTRYLDHTPWHALCLTDVWQLFPAAQIVHLVRHPAEVVPSLGRSYRSGYHWAGRTDRERLALWQRFVAAMAPYEADARVRTLRYEDLWRSSERAAQALFAWLGLPWQDAYLRVLAQPYASNRARPHTIARAAQQGLVFQPYRPTTPPIRLVALLSAEARADLTRYCYAANGYVLSSW
ncbi:MAG: sulfotransferase [Actinomycetota bacterium]|nr:sulfotransferase [Actinomycetota bacterium]